MNRLKTWIIESIRMIVPIVILAVGIGGFLVLGERPEVESKQSRSDRTPLVETASAIDFGKTLTLEVEGVAVPYRTVTLGAEVAGRILTLEDYARAGRTVTADQPLLQIDPEEYQIEMEKLLAEQNELVQKLEELKVAAENAKSLMQIAQTTYQLQQREYDRIETLFARKASSQADLDAAQNKLLTVENSRVSAENQYKTATIQQETLKAQQKLVEAKIKQAQLNIDRTTINAPITGSLTSVEVEKNDFVQRGDILATMIDTEAMEVKCSLRVDELLWVWEQAWDRMQSGPALKNYELPPTPVRVVYPFQGNTYYWAGTLSRFEGNGLDAQTRTVPCRVLVEKPTEVRMLNQPEEPVQGIQPPALFSGMYVTIQIPIQPQRKLLSIPQTALQPGNVVWVSQNGKLEIRNVSVARMQQETVLLDAMQSELSAGETVITSPIPMVQDGMTIREQK